MTHPISEPSLAAAGGESNGPLHLGRADAAASDLPDVTPEVLRELHAAWVRQLRGHVIGWSFVAAGAVVLWAATRTQMSGPVVLIVALMVLQWGRAVVDWRRARQTDPIATASADAAAATELERGRVEALQQLMAQRGAAATWTLAALVIAVGVIEWLTAGTVDRTVARAGLVKPLVSEGEWWRLATAAFVHAGLLHLTANMSALLVFGRIFEAYAPRPWLFVTYAAAALAGNAASWWLVPAASSLGASGAVMGVVGFLLVLGWRRREEMPHALRQQVWMTIIGTGFVGALSFGLIDNAAHAGGAAAGALVALIAVRRTASEPVTRSGSWLFILGGLSAIAIVAGAVRTTVALAEGSSTSFSRRSLSRETIPPVRSVSAAVGHDASGWFVDVINGGSQALEAYELTIGGAGVTAHLQRDDCCFESNEMGPVPAHGSIRVRLGDGGDRLYLGQHFMFTVAMFADGSFEGSKRARDLLVKRRAGALAEAAFWIRIVDKAATESPAAAARRLVIYRDARAMFADVSTAAINAFGIPSLIKLAEADPAHFPEAAARTKAAILRSQEALAMRLKIPAPR